MIEEYKAVKSRVEVNALLGKVEDAARVDGTGTLRREQYVILFGGPADELDDDRLGSSPLPTSDAEYEYTARAVAVTALGVLEVMNQVMAQLVGYTPVITGRKCGAIRPGPTDKVRADYSVKPPLFYLDQDFLLKSSRA